MILNEDQQIHLKNFKPMPATDPLVDSCTECGFCEPVCPTRGLTVTPRQRIVGAREVARLEGARDHAELPRFRAEFLDFGIELLRGLRHVRNGLSGRNQHRPNDEGDPRAKRRRACARRGVLRGE